MNIISNTNPNLYIIEIVGVYKNDVVSLSLKPVVGFNITTYEGGIDKALPLVAGSCSEQSKNFIFVDILTGLAWSIPGYISRMNWLKVIEDVINVEKDRYSRPELDVEGASDAINKFSLDQFINKVSLKVKKYEDTMEATSKRSIDRLIKGL